MGRLVLAELDAASDLTLAWSAGRVLPDALDADVIIDFSTPDGLLRLLDHASCPVVSGTTGVVLPDRVAVPFLHAANFSLGVAVLARLVREAAAALPSWDVELVELHHRHKRDAPSGTALRLIDGLGAPVSGRTGPRVPGEIGVHAVRGGDIVGEHRVYLCGPGERIELAHVATHRGLFAAGAVTAARWIVGKPPGRYQIEDVLGG
jgi:4-hydroxy-tetrahydrodipicolinate reductase